MSVQIPAAGEFRWIHMNHKDSKAFAFIGRFCAPSTILVFADRCVDLRIPPGSIQPQQVRKIVNNGMTESIRKT